MFTLPKIKSIWHLGVESNHQVVNLYGESQHHMLFIMVRDNYPQLFKS
jgi:hypothetical protein